jgi:hypothetical protein
MVGLKKNKYYLLAIGCAAVAVLPTIVALFFLLQTQWLKHTMRLRLEEQNLQTLTLSPVNFQWVAYGQELTIKEYLFDVKTYTLHKNGMVTVVGLFDHQEESLQRQVNNLWHQQKNNQANSQHVATFLFAFCYCQHGFINSLPDNSNVSSFIFINRTAALCHVCIPPRTLPPNLIA